MSERTLPFAIGQTYFNGAPTNSTDADAFLGQDVIMKDRIRNQARTRHLRAVRNSSGFTVLPKRAVELSADGRTILGYAIDGKRNWALVDERLPSTGVVANDICWVVWRGPALGLTPLSNQAADYTQGDLVAPITATTSGATTAGRLKARSVAAATADATAGQRNTTENDAAQGRCVSTGILTNSTNNDILVDVRPL